MKYKIGVVLKVIMLIPDFLKSAFSGSKLNR
jgi:hypothetical protein